MKIVILKNDEIILKKKEYFNMKNKISELQEQLSPFHKFSINEIRAMFGFPKIEEISDLKNKKIKKVKLRRQSMAKQTINEYIGIGLLLSPNFDVSKFTSSDLRVFINSARKKIKQLINYEEKLETRLRNTYQAYYSDSELRELERWFVDTKIGCENIE